MRNCFKHLALYCLAGSLGMLSAAETPHVRTVVKAGKSGKLVRSVVITPARGCAQGD